MRILHVINSLEPGGAEKLLVDLLLNMKSLSLEVDLLLLKGKNTPFYQKAIENGIEVEQFGRDNNPYNLLNIWRLQRKIRKYDIVHSHLFPANYYVALANILNGRRTKLVTTEHNTTNRRRKLFLLKPVERFIYNQYKDIISISDAVDSNLKDHLGSNFKNINKIYNGINLTEINTAQAYGRTEIGFAKEDFLLLMVASFTPQKDQATLIKSLLDLPASVKLILVGTGPLMEEHRILTEKLNLSSRVTFLGIRNDVPSLLKTVDIVILSSHYEGLSLSSVEGLASGKPFIASDVPGLSEVVSGAGILFPERDSRKLAAEIVLLIENNDQMNKVVRKCRNRAEDFDITIMTEKYKNLYTNLIS